MPGRENYWKTGQKIINRLEKWMKNRNINENINENELSLYFEKKKKTRKKVESLYKMNKQSTYVQQYI